ncbi:MAG TPA: MmgE/PrpD family protein [Gammaproteobacteria bacterium]|nr:MmgE/PrpD family protein [Gammaproteobacteria bacterium]
MTTRKSGSRADGPPSLTAALAHHASAVRIDELPATVVERGRHCLLDWLGCSLAGSREPLSAILREEAASEGGSERATLVGSSERTGVQQAALVNGAASHALDFDDVAVAMTGHPSVPVWPAVLALGEARGADGSDLLAAFVAGVEVECLAGLAVSPGHYRRGFHATGTLGTFGAAAGCANLLALDPGRTAVALGIAGTAAAGLKCMFGTMCKPLHAGRAAASGAQAATLAERGFTAEPAVLEAHQGFAATQTDSFEPERALAAIGDGWQVEKVLFKHHAACYETHSTIEACRRLRPVDPGVIESVRIRVSPGHLDICNIERPETGLQGKFSLRFCAALALAGHDTGYHAFTDAAVRDPSVDALRARIAVEPADDLPPGHDSEVIVTSGDGETRRESVDVHQPVPDAHLAHQWQRLADKFRELARPLVGPAHAETLIEMVADVERLPGARRLLDAARARTPEAASP